MEKKRILNRVIFINIANTDYSSVEIAGNACFVGTNNLGKTTLQRAILFFYNANTRWLGISSSQRSFEDYYFQFPNSYIIYEIMTEEGFFHVMVYRNNKICYRFVESEFRQDIYIVDSVALMPKEIIGRLNENKINYTDQIETFERYRNIIYGADPEKRYKKYALLKGNSMYHNIPLAITSIFLSSESVIRAEFVKDCIANSISTKHTSIELKTIERQLRQFSERYQDIEAFFRKDNSQRGDFIKDNFLQIKNLKVRQRTLAAELGAALRYAESKKETLEKELQEKDSQIEELTTQFSEEEKAFQERLTGINEERGIVKGRLREIEKKWKEYESKNIDELLRLSEDKITLQAELKARESEYLTLTAQFQDTEQQFKTLFNALENEKKEFENSIKSLGLELDKKFQEDKSALMGRFQKEKDSLKEKHLQETEKFREQINQKNLELKDLEFQIREIKKKNYFETETGLLRRNLNELREGRIRKKSEKEVKLSQVETIQKQSDYIRDKYKLAFDQFVKKNREETEATEDQIREIEDKLSVYQDAFFGFLQENYPDWFETIGKVVNEKLLYSKNLSPKLIKKGLDTFYGIQLDLSEAEVQCRSLEELEKEKSEFRDYIAELNQNFLNFQEKHEADQQEELGILGRKIGKLKNEIAQIDYELSQDDQKEKQLELDLLEWQEKARAQKEKDTTTLYIKEQELKDETAGIKSELNNLNKQQDDKINSLSESYNEKLYQLKKVFDEKAGDLSEQKNDKLAEINKRKTKLEKEKSDALKKKGVDDSGIRKLKQVVADLKEKLESIDDSAELVINFRKDKRELFDRREDFEQEKKELDLKVDEENTRFKSQKQVFEKKRSLVQEERQLLAGEQRSFTEGLNHFNKHFREKSLYDRLRHIIDAGSEVQTTTGLTDLCSQLLTNDAEFHKQFQTFRNHITDYIGRFRPDNHFNFRINPHANEAEYESFAVQLQDFYNENKIQTSISEVARSHGMLIDAIASKVKALTDHMGRINRMVAKMESDFSRASFESSRLIEYIKLKSEDSENKVLRKLQKIAEFREQNPFAYGETNLFNSDSKVRNEIDRKSVELLNDLLKTISEENYDEIRVQDLFELRFRIKEGKNDTGWIEKIDKVGSTGTDMLVKAVIYITLLNVFIKESTERTAQNFKVHCIIDEVGQISASYLKELISFAEERNIYLINGLPNESKLETHYNYTYKFRKDQHGNVKVIPLLTMSVEP
jgi:hypothetical protein